MRNRTLIPIGTPTNVDEAIARFEEAMRRKPPKQRNLSSARQTQKNRREMFQRPSQHELFVTERIAHGTIGAQERFDLSE